MEGGTVEAGGSGDGRNSMSMVCEKYKLEDIFLGRFCWYIYTLHQHWLHIIASLLRYYLLIFIFFY